MKRITLKIAGRSALVAALTLGVAGGVAGVASAAPVNHHVKSHDRHQGHERQRHVEGVVTAYVAGASISVRSDHSLTPVVYTLTPTTTITGLASGASIVMGDHVNLILSSTASGTVTSMRVQTSN